MRDQASPSARAPCALTVTDTGRGMAARGRRARLRAVLHHQGGLRPRRRARPGDGLRDRHQRARADRARVRAGRRARRSRCCCPRCGARATTQPSPSAPRGRGETVLVVEDADAVRVLTGRILYAAGYQVVSVESGAVALERLDAADVLVTDVVMPGMSGVELAVHRARAPSRPPVVFVSGYTGDTTIAGSDDPATAFLAKPFDGDDLLRAVRSPRSDARAERNANRELASLVGERLQDVDPRGAAGGQRGGEHARQRGDDRHRQQAGDRDARSSARTCPASPRPPPASTRPGGDPEHRADQRRDHALVADHPAHLAAVHAQRAQRAELARALEGREHERVDDAEQATRSRRARAAPTGPRGSARSRPSGRR